MKVSYKKPWLWPVLKIFFPEIDFERTITTIRDTVYTKYPLTICQEAHEKVHIRQQQRFWPIVLARYIISPTFRLKCELEASRAEWECIKWLGKNKKVHLERITANLSKISNITINEAKKLICE